MGRTIFSMAVFPAVLSGAVVSTIEFMDRGVDPLVAFVPAIVFTYLFVMLCERALPYRPDWNRPRGDVPVDLGHLMISGGVTLSLLRPVMLALALATADLLSAHVSPRLWPADWALVPQLALALVVGEFFMYWAHRLGHEWEILWRFHATHHSAPRLYFLNAVRFHPVDIAISTYAPFVPLVALGAEPEVLALFTLVSGVHGVFQHTNLPIRLGPLNWFFSMAQLHRWHHSRRVAESNTNYGQNLIVWDVVFGTRYLPKNHEPPADIGIADLDAFPMDYLGQIASPARWRHIQRDSAADRARGALSPGTAPSPS
jgi:sterol desaturase/sphingolipid hydroxylase (fatty acid hydroxylase superfamily)